MFKWLEQYFTFTKTERNAIVVLIALCVVVVIAPKVYFMLRPVEHISNKQSANEVKAFANSYSAGEENEAAPVDSPGSRKAVLASPDTAKPVALAKRATAATYFDFDPNKIGVAEWVKLGFTEKQAITIEHYKEKGGKFYKPTDLKRLYVMTDEHYENLAPFVKIDVEALPKKKYRARE